MSSKRLSHGIDVFPSYCLRDSTVNVRRSSVSSGGLTNGQVSVPVPALLNRHGSRRLPDRPRLFFDDNDTLDEEHNLPENWLRDYSPPDLSLPAATASSALLSLQPASSKPSNDSIERADASETDSTSEDVSQLYNWLPSIARPASSLPKDELKLDRSSTVPQRDESVCVHSTPLSNLSSLNTHSHSYELPFGFPLPPPAAHTPRLVPAIDHKHENDISGPKYIHTLRSQFYRTGESIDSAATTASSLHSQQYRELGQQRQAHIPSYRGITTLFPRQHSSAPHPHSRPANNDGPFAAYDPSSLLSAPRLLPPSQSHRHGRYSRHCEHRWTSSSPVEESSSKDIITEDKTNEGWIDSPETTQYLTTHSVRFHDAWPNRRTRDDNHGNEDDDEDTGMERASSQTTSLAGQMKHTHPGHGPLSLWPIGIPLQAPSPSNTSNSSFSSSARPPSPSVSHIGPFSTSKSPSPSPSIPAPPFSTTSHVSKASSLTLSGRTMSLFVRTVLFVFTLMVIAVTVLSIAEAKRES